MYRNLIFFTLLLGPLNLSSIEFMKDYFDYNEERPLPKVSNDLVYGDGSSEVTSQITESNLTANQPIQGSIFVTHDSKNAIDISSFRLGAKPLKVTFVQSSLMSPTSNIAVAVYSFQLEGLPTGVHTLPSINVKVGSKQVQALPLVIAIP
jgi:hypothetical protein